MKKNKYIRWILFLSIGFFCIYIFPFLALAGPPRLRDYMHRELVYKVIVNKLLNIIKTDDDKEKCLLLMKYVNQHLFSFQPGFEIVDMHPLNDLLRGLGECDQLANTLITLARKAHIKGRLLFLRGNKKSSQHSVSELYTNGRFRIFDPTFSIVFINNNGNIATFEDIQKGNIDYIPHKLNLSLSDFDYVKKIYFSLYKSDYKPVYFRTNFEQDIKRFLLSRLVDLYYSLFKEVFFIPYQEVYFKFSRTDLFTKARLRHITFRYNSAIHDYDKIIKSIKDNFIKDEAMYFKAQAYWDMGQYLKAIEEFEDILYKRPDTRRKRLVLFYLADSYKKLGDRDKFRFYLSQLYPKYAPDI